MYCSALRSALAEYLLLASTMGLAPIIPNICPVLHQACAKNAGLLLPVPRTGYLPQTGWFLPSANCRHSPAQTTGKAMSCVNLLAPEAHPDYVWPSQYSCG